MGQKKSDYFVKRYFGSGIIIKEAVKKYGRENFIIEILQWCKDKEELDYYEVYYIKKLKSNYKFGNYNISDGGSGASYGKNNPMYGRKGALNPNYNNKSNFRWSEEDKKRISKRLEINGHPLSQKVNVCDINKNNFLDTRSMKEASEYTCIPHSSLRKYLNIYDIYVRNVYLISKNKKYIKKEISIYQVDYYYIEYRVNGKMGCCDSIKDFALIIGMKNKSVSAHFIRHGLFRRNDNFALKVFVNQINGFRYSNIVSEEVK